MQPDRVARAIVLSGLVAAASTTASAQNTVVKIQDYPGSGNVLFRVAASKNFCEKQGITCQLQMIPSGPLGAQALLSKSIDVAYVPPETPILATLKGATMKIIVNGQRNNPFLIVARNEPATPDGNKDFRAMMVALKGKKIGVPARGAGSELQFRLLATKAGLNPADYAYVAVGSGATAYGALKSLQVDAVMGFEPLGSMCSVLKECSTVYRAAVAEAPAEIAKTNGGAAVNVVRQDTIEQSPKIADAIIAAAKDSEAFIQNPANFSEVVKIVASYSPLTMEKGDQVMDAMMRFLSPSYKTSVSREAVAQVAQNMLEMKQIQAPFDTSVLFYAKCP